jgi:hypothetical protein
LLTFEVRISGLNLNHIKAALSARSAVFEQILLNGERGETTTTNPLKGISMYSVFSAPSPYTLTRLADR